MTILTTLVLFCCGLSPISEPIGYFAGLCTFIAILECYKEPDHTRIDAALSLAKLFFCVVSCLVCPFASNDLKLIALGKHLRDANPQWYYLTVAGFFVPIALAIACTYYIQKRKRLWPC